MLLRIWITFCLWSPSNFLEAESLKLEGRLLGVHPNSDRPDPDVSISVITSLIRDHVTQGL